MPGLHEQGGAEGRRDWQTARCMTRFLLNKENTANLCIQAICIFLYPILVEQAGSDLLYGGGASRFAGLITLVTFSSTSGKAAGAFAHETYTGVGYR